MSRALGLIDENRFGEAANALASLDQGRRAGGVPLELRRRIAHAQLRCAIRWLPHTSGEIVWPYLCGIDAALFADLDGLDRVKTHCAQTIAWALERRRSLEDTDWAALIEWRRRAATLSPGLVDNWRLLVMALLYGGRPEAEVAAVFASAPAELADPLRQVIGAAPRVLPALRLGDDFVYGRTAPGYVGRGLPVVPCLGKKALFKDWRRFSDEMPDPERLTRWMAIPWAQIGLVLGAQSNIAMMDVDTIDPRLAEAVAEALPPSPWRRVGWRGMALAFRRSAVRPARATHFAEGGPDRSVVFDYLGDGRLLMLPPSIHPNTGAPYRANCHLAEVSDDLPEVPPDYAERIVHQAAKAGYSLRWRSHDTAPAPRPDRQVVTVASRSLGV